MDTSCACLASLVTHFREEEERCDSISRVCADIEHKVRQFLIPPLHTQPIEEYTAALERAYLPVVEDLRECYKQLSGLVPPTLYHKYRDHWRTHVQRQVQAMALLHFLQTNALVPHADAQQAVCGGYLALELDDYLCGVASLPADLANLSVALAIRGAYAFVVQAHAFVVELHAAFQQLNLKNDALRRRFDGIKYDVKRLEQMVYDLRIRSLVPPPPAAHAK